MASHLVRVGPLPGWLDHRRLLGPGDWQPSIPSGDRPTLQAQLSSQDAADLAARLRGVALDGHALHLECSPRLKRNAVRAGRLAEARRLRDTSTGFDHPQALAAGEGRFSLTPQALADTMARAAQGRRVVDACAGSGGNAIAFARAGCPVVAIERDADRLAEARHNANLHGVVDRVEFIHGNALHHAPQAEGDILFLDPPWGEHAGAPCSLADFPLLGALRQCGYPTLWAKLPSGFACASLPECAPQAMFGAAPGDARRIKFLWLRSDPRDAAHRP